MGLRAFHVAGHSYSLSFLQDAEAEGLFDRHVLDVVLSIFPALHMGLFGHDECTQVLGVDITISVYDIGWRLAWHIVKLWWARAFVVLHVLDMLWFLSRRVFFLPSRRSVVHIHRRPPPGA